MTAPTTHRATQEHGLSVVEGRLVWTSASGITTADPNSYGGCLRRWWYEKVGGRDTEETEAMRGGTALHAEVEDHLRTGTSLTSPLALAGRMFIPQPGSGLFIERPIHFRTRGGVDIFGHVDLYNFRQEYLDPDGALLEDPPWSFEVKDWKTTSDFKYAKSERELAENIQLVTYAEAGFRFAPDSMSARLTHAYFLTKGRPASKLVTIRRTREEIAGRWEYAESVVRSMADVARETSAETVEGKRKACDAYSGCPHRSVCSIYRHNALDSLYGKVVTDHLQEKQMGLIASTQPQLLQQATTAPAAPSMQQQLAHEEQQMRAQVMQQQQMPAALNKAEFAVVCTRLGSYGYGFPSLSSNAAQAYADLGGQHVHPGFVFQGIPAPAGARRSLHSIQLSEVAHIYQLEGELAAERGQVPPIMQAPVQPPVQAPEPQYVPYTPAQATANGPGAGMGGGGGGGVIVYTGVLSPGAPESMPQLASPQAAPAAKEYRPTISPDATPGAPNAPHGYTLGSEPGATPVAHAAEEGKKKRGRPAKAQDVAPESVAPPAAQIAAPAALPAVATQVAPAAPSPIPAGLYSSAALDAGVGVTSGTILINARFADKPTKSLAGYIDYINGELSKRYSVTADGKPGIQDVRCAPKDSVLAFGAWKGAVREIVKADPPPPDAYHLDLFRDELNEVVADALRVVAKEKGWLYIRGIQL